MPILARFADGGPLLVQATANLTPEQWSDHPIPGTWSVAELVSHLDEAAALFAANRQWMARILKAQDEAAFAREGMHTEKGRQTLAEVLVYATNHLDHHLKFLYTKRAKLGVAIYPRYTANTGV
jgi:hypothetical protein